MGLSWNSRISRPFKERVVGPWNISSSRRNILKRKERHGNMTVKCKWEERQELLEKWGWGRNSIQPSAKFLLLETSRINSLIQPHCLSLKKRKRFTEATAVTIMLSACYCTGVLELQSIFLWDGGNKGRKICVIRFCCISNNSKHPWPPILNAVSKSITTHAYFSYIGNCGLTAIQEEGWRSSSSRGPSVFMAERREQQRACRNACNGT